MFFEIFNFFLRIGKYTGRSVRGASGHREHRRGHERSNKGSSVCVIFECFFFLDLMRGKKEMLNFQVPEEDG